LKDKILEVHQKLLKMSTIKKQYNTIVLQAKKGVPGFANAYAKFIEKVTINQSRVHFKLSHLSGNR
jgi:hypothetical protein